TGGRARHLVKRLPSFSPIAIKLMAMVNDENVSFKEVAKLFSADPVLAGQVLQLANSGMYGRQAAPVQSVLHAMAILGLKNISRIALTAALSHGFPRSTAAWTRSWWRHSIATALIADHVGTAELHLDVGYTAGLLHAIGQLALFQNAPEEYPQLIEDVHSAGADLIQCERNRFGADHVELAGLIVADWGSPQDLRQAIVKSHLSNFDDPLTATVQAGCWYAESVGFGQCGCIQDAKESVPGHSARPLDQYLLDVLTIEVNRIECSLR
ncbi:MAG: HDOD domain-containing protein, partial [Acidobacteriota bacterium]